MIRAVESKGSSANDQSEATLKPLLKSYIHAVDHSNWDAVRGFFHPDAVVVLKGREVTYGVDNIISNKTKFVKMSGKSTTTLSHLKYEGAGDYLVVSGSLTASTEKIGTLKGRFIQIWKREGEKHSIFHDQFEITP